MWRDRGLIIHYQVHISRARPHPEHILTADYLDCKDLIQTHSVFGACTVHPIPAPLPTMPRTPLLLLLAIAIGAAPALGLHIHAKPAVHLNRRDALHRAATAGLGFLALPTSPAPSNADVIRAPGRCANGEGDGCADLAGDNDLIQSLQRKSSENKAANQRVGRENFLPGLVLGEGTTDNNDNALGIKGEFGWVGWAAVAVILNDVAGSYLEKRRSDDEP